VPALGVGARRGPRARWAAKRGDLAPAQATNRCPQGATHRDGEEKLEPVAHAHRRSLTSMAIDFTLSPDAEAIRRRTRALVEGGALEEERWLQSALHGLTR